MGQQLLPLLYGCRRLCLDVDKTPSETSDGCLNPGHCADVDLGIIGVLVQVEAVTGCNRKAISGFPYKTLNVEIIVSGTVYKYINPITTAGAKS